MKKILSLLIAAVMLLSLAPLALAEDINIEFQFHKGETDAINAMTAAIKIFFIDISL